MPIQDEVLLTSPHWEKVLAYGNIELNARDYVPLAFAIRLGDIAFAYLAETSAHPQVAQSHWGIVSINPTVPIGTVRTAKGNHPLPWYP